MKEIPPQLVWWKKCMKFILIWDKYDCKLGINGHAVTLLFRGWKLHIHTWTQFRIVVAKTDKFEEKNYIKDSITVTNNKIKLNICWHVFTLLFWSPSDRSEVSLVNWHHPIQLGRPGSAPDFEIRRAHVLVNNVINHSGGSRCGRTTLILYSWVFAYKYHIYVCM